VALRAAARGLAPMRIAMTAKRGRRMSAKVIG
jgi:hypothetical protein